MVDAVFANILDDIMKNGEEVNTRNSITKRKLNLTATFNSTPLIGVRRTAWKNALREMEWFLSGSSNINDLHEKVRHWWEPWANESGFIHNNYSKQFRQFDGTKHFGGTRIPDSTDQIQYMIDTLKNHPYSRRNVITTWHTHDMVSPNTSITNCHGSLIMVNVSPNTNEVHLTMVQRSADMVLGVPHNFIQYWAFLLYLAYQSGRKVGSFTWLGNDCHIYQDHYQMVDKIVDQYPYVKPTPNLIYNSSSSEFKADDFSLDTNYKPLIKESLKMTV